MDNMIWVWLGGVVLFGVVEAFTAGLVSIWFVVGAVAALIATVFGAPLGAQIAVFLVISAAALAVTRPLMRKIITRKSVPTNLDRVIGQTGKVTEEINNADSLGAVYVDGKTWSARSLGDKLIPVGTTVSIVKMEGVKLFVEKATILEEVKV